MSRAEYAGDVREKTAYLFSAKKEDGGKKNRAKLPQAAQ